jgi:lysozyme
VILEHEDYLKAARLSIDEALAILKTDMADAESAVEKYIKVELNDNQFAALCSFTFNLGAGSLKASTLKRLLNRGDYNSVPGQLKRWVFAGKTKLKGLVRRRRDEGVLFQSEAQRNQCESCGQWID